MGKNQKKQKRSNKSISFPPSSETENIIESR